jgi:hypothetical protein
MGSTLSSAGVDARDLAGVILPDGTFYVFYTRIGSTSSIGGFIQGAGKVSQGEFSSQDAIDFNFEGDGQHSATLAAVAKAKDSLNGSINYPGGTQVNFTAQYIADFEQTPSLSLVQGTYSGGVIATRGLESASLTISPDGALTGSSGQCSALGKVSPRVDGNLYDISVTFGSGSCVYPGQTFSGVGYLDLVNGNLIAGVVNQSRQAGVFFQGKR